MVAGQAVESEGNVGSGALLEVAEGADHLAVGMLGHGVLLALFHGLFGLCRVVSRMWVSR